MNWTLTAALGASLIGGLIAAIVAWRARAEAKMLRAALRAEAQGRPGDRAADADGWLSEGG